MCVGRLVAPVSGDGRGGDGVWAGRVGWGEAGWVLVIAGGDERALSSEVGGGSSVVAGVHPKVGGGRSEGWVAMGGVGFVGVVLGLPAVCLLLAQAR